MSRFRIRIDSGVRVENFMCFLSGGGWSTAPNLARSCKNVGNFNIAPSCTLQNAVAA